jgi:ABC-2 type transport system permease protein
MNTAFDDIKILLRLRLRLLRRVGIRSGRARNRGGSFIVGGLIVGVVLLQFGVLIATSLTALLSQGLSDPGGRATLALALAGLSSSLSLFLFLLALPSVLALLTYSSDLKLLLLTPLRPWVTLGEKLASVYGVLAGPVLVLGLPVLIGIGQAAGASAAYYVAAALVLLLLPVAPVALALLLTVAVLRWIPPARARAVTAVLGALLSGGIYVGTQLLVNPRTYAQASGPPRLFTDVARGPWGLLPVVWPGRALGLLIAGASGAGIAYLVAAVVTALVLAGLAVTLSSRLFATGWATYQEVDRRTRRAIPGGAGVVGGVASERAGALALAAPVGATEIVALPQAICAPIVDTGAARLTRRPPWWPLVGKEWRTLRRDPQVWARLLYSFVVIGFLFWQNLSRVSLTSTDTAGLPVSLGSIGFFGLLCFLLWLPLTTLALPAVNREGRALFVLALAPVSARDILLSKWIFSAAPSLVLSEALLGVGAWWLRLGPGQVLLGACALAAIAVAVAGALLFVSLIWPRLDWDNPRRQVSSQASLVGVIGGLLLVGASAGLLILTLFLTPSHPLLALASGAGLFALTGLIALFVFLLAPARLAALLMAER